MPLASLSSSYKVSSRLSNSSISVQTYLLIALATLLSMKSFAVAYLLPLCSTATCRFLHFFLSVLVNVLAPQMAPHSPRGTRGANETGSPGLSPDSPKRSQSSFFCDPRQSRFSRKALSAGYGLRNHVHLV